jgi:hypothetical protein
MNQHQSPRVKVRNFICVLPSLLVLSNSFILENPSTGGKSKGAGKLYRNIAPVFSIDDDQDGGIEKMLNNYKASNS